ncbi:hypothetical protein LCGC14_1394140 [marine sediment metagenome]|uniref:Metalloprotease TldD/E C-terminal domain-containing protein n=1 Tax=marine sediment metagenome TaxID=412755 RepID=A0A0F9MEJ4_9ZZZZ
MPSIEITNFIMKSRDMFFEEIIKDIEESIFSDYTGDSANLATGDFSDMI